MKHILKIIIIHKKQVIESFFKLKSQSHLPANQQPQLKKLIYESFFTITTVLETCDCVDGGVEELEVLVVSPFDSEFVKLTAGLNEGHAAILEDGARGIQVGVAALGRIHAAMILASERKTKTNVSIFLLELFGN